MIIPDPEVVIRVMPGVPALILAPMDGLTDAPMRAVQGEAGAFTFAVSEFLRVSSEVPPARMFHRHIPELCGGGRTLSGLPVQVQLLGGDPGRMARSAVVACQAGARAIDINFGCPAPTVNRHDGGATLLKHPERIREIVAAVRAALPAEIPVSAKMRLGWESVDDIFENAAMAEAGGAAWLTIHGRTRAEGYKPPAHWPPIGRVRERLGIPVVANGDIWSLDDFRRCRAETGCLHFMLGRGALADPFLSARVACDLGIGACPPPGGPQEGPQEDADWVPRLRRLVEFTDLLRASAPDSEAKAARGMAARLKQWLQIAHRHGRFSGFDAVKRAQSVEELLAGLQHPCGT